MFALANGRGALPASPPYRAANRLDGRKPAYFLSASRSAAWLRGRKVPLGKALSWASGSKRVIGQGGALETVPANTPALDWSSGRPRFRIEALPATNIFLNSEVGVTQSVALTAGSWTVSFWGTGSLVLSGSASGTLAGLGAASRASLTVPATAGACTVTVTGSCSKVQVESGGEATSYIATTGSSVTRIADDVRISTDALPFTNGGGGASIALRAKLTTATTYARLLGDPSVDTSVIIREATNQGVGVASASGSAWIYGGASLFSDFGITAAYSSTSKKISKAGLEPPASATSFPTLLGLRIFGGYFGGNANGFLDELVIWTISGSNSGIKSQARAFS